ncbi:MAG TPA: carbon-nitrogen hydrolase [Thermodesulfobacteriota bacterium]|nr:carbon-nitrogen hydrolase [Thermodesulfobacteriota bacterium]
MNEKKHVPEGFNLGTEVSIGLIQTAVTKDIQENIQKTVSFVRKATAQGAQIICLQELFGTIYFPQHERFDASGFAETISGDTVSLFSRLAKELGIVIIVPLFEKAQNGNYYNSAVTIDADGSILGVYRKIHIPFDKLFYEKNYFKDGDLGYQVYKTRFASIGVLICYDQWNPEAARINTLMGAEIIFYPTAIGWIKGHTSQDGDWHNAWETVQRGHAIANGVHVAAVNRIGEEEQLQFWGGSFVADAFGKVIKKASHDREEILVATIDLSMNKKIREGWGFLNNRRPDTYSPICK